MEHTYYEFNSSQDVIRLQTKYALYKRVQNILFYTIVEKGFDMVTMHKAINMMIERNDCLRITFEKRNGKTMQYFAEKRTIEDIPYKEFKTESAFISFMNRFRVRSTNCFKGDVLRVIFAKDPDGHQIIIFKISHYVADTYGISVLIQDLFSVYEALEEGSELPPIPGSFEEVLKKDMAFIHSEESVAKDKEFFQDLSTKIHPEPPVYCGIHGNHSDRWLKYKNKGYTSLPYLFVRCETEGYRFTIPAAITEKAVAWCEQTGNTISSFFMYTYEIAASLVNGRERYQMPLELLNSRATLAERKAAGTKVQSISVYTEVDYDKNFEENLAVLRAEQNMLYRHTKYTYVEVEKILHKNWNFKMSCQISNFCFSFIPVSNPKGVKLNVYSNGRGSLVVYVALMYDIDTKEINMVYDIQKRMITPNVLIEFQNLYIHVIETVLASPNKKLSEIF